MRHADITLSAAFFDDERIKQLMALPEGDAMVVLWVKLLCIAAKNPQDDGRLMLTKSVPYTDEIVATQSGKPLTLVRMALSAYAGLSMLCITDDGAMVIAEEWRRCVDAGRGADKHKQSKESSKEKNARRQRAWRARRKAEKAAFLSQAPSVARLPAPADEDGELDDLLAELRGKFPGIVENSNVERVCLAAELRREGVDAGVIMEGCAWFAEQVGRGKVHRRPKLRNWLRYHRYLDFGCVGGFKKADAPPPAEYRCAGCGRMMALDRTGAMYYCENCDAALPVGMLRKRLPPHDSA